MLDRRVIVAAVLVAACGDDRARDPAEQTLIDDGYTQIEIVERSEDGRVLFEATRGAERCRGELSMDPTRYAVECRPAETLDAIERDCERGDLDRCVEAAALARTEPPIDWPRATRSSVRACEGGRAQECLYVGMARELGGRGLPQDRALARSMYERACEAGMPPACARRDALDRP